MQQKHCDIDDDDDRHCNKLDNDGGTNDMKTLKNQLKNRFARFRPVDALYVTVGGAGKFDPFAQTHSMLNFDDKESTRRLNLANTKLVELLQKGSTHKQNSHRRGATDTQLHSSDVGIHKKKHQYLSKSLPLLQVEFPLSSSSSMEDGLFSSGGSKRGLGVKDSSSSGYHRNNHVSILGSEFQNYNDKNKLEDIMTSITTYSNVGTEIGSLPHVETRNPTNLTELDDERDVLIDSALSSSSHHEDIKSKSDDECGEGAEFSIERSESNPEGNLPDLNHMPISITERSVQDPHFGNNCIIAETGEADQQPQRCNETSWTMETSLSNYRKKEMQVYIPKEKLKAGSRVRVFWATRGMDRTGTVREILDKSDGKGTNVGVEYDDGEWVDHMSIEDWPHTILSLPNDDIEAASLNHHHVAHSDSENNEGPDIKRDSDQLDRTQENDEQETEESTSSLREYDVDYNESSYRQQSYYIDPHSLNNNIHTDEDDDMLVSNSKRGSEEFKSKFHIDRPKSLFVGKNSISEMALIVTPTHNLMDFSPCTHGTPHTVVDGKTNSLGRIVPKPLKDAQIMLEHVKQRSPFQMERESYCRRKSYTTKKSKVSSAMSQRPKSQGREPDEISSPIHKPIHLRLKRHRKQQVPTVSPNTKVESGT